MWSGKYPPAHMKEPVFCLCIRVGVTTCFSLQFVVVFVHIMYTSQTSDTHACMHAERAHTHTARVCVATHMQHTHSQSWG